MSSYLVIKIKTGGNFSEKELNIRYTLADTIEERGIGEVVEEGIGEDYLLIAIKIKSVKKTESKIKSILHSLGLLDITEFSYPDKIKD